MSTLVWTYFISCSADIENFMVLTFFNPPDALGSMYTRNFFRATWIMTSLDAGFYSAMHIRTKWLRDILSIVFSVTFALFPDAANEVVRKHRQNVSIETLRNCLEKSTSPYLHLLSTFDRGYLRIRRNITIPLPAIPSKSAFKSKKKSPIKARLYFYGTDAQLKESSSLIFHIPGGGFVAMKPEVCCFKNRTTTNMFQIGLVGQKHQY